MKLIEQAMQATVIQALITQHPNLPAADLQAGRVYPGTVEVSIHEGFVHWEQWREALGVDPAETSYRQHSGFASVEGWAKVGGLSVRLVGYGALSAAQLAGQVS
ncbi:MULTISPECIES: hypothetical protein [unclassified Streptomyces]|uniref:hypothetical protein n=1 Tax=unclassified Streptomyces TaxID=2593676 RepID=UPI00081DF0A4|nr:MULTISPECIES: hypothetical protein [unclassified Streptomyces]MYR28646.1 hypothetical protein [Streptomyces sp. SID4945]SCF40065.1 hypothetical protein GA0115257_11562 [Streptomyces sp. LcepLS]